MKSALMWRYSIKRSLATFLLLLGCLPVFSQHVAGVIKYRAPEWQEKLEGYMEQQPDSAFLMLDEAWAVAVAESDVGLQAWVLKRRGTVFMYLSNTSKSIQHYLRALEIYRDIKDSASIAGMYMNLGNVAGTKSEKIDFYQKSIALYMDLDNQEGVAKNLVNLGTIYLDYREMDSARYYFDRALTLSREINATATITSSLLNLAIVHESFGEVQMAIGNIKRALVFYEKEDITIGRVYGYFNLSQFYLRLGELKQAEQYLDLTLATAQHSFLTIQQHCYDTYKEICVKRNDYALALRYQKLQDSLSLLNSTLSTEKLFSRMEAEYNANSKEATIEKLDAEVSQALYIRSLLFVLLGSSFLFGGVSFYLQRDSGKKAQALLRQAREYAHTQRELARVELQHSELKKEKLNARLQYTEAELINFAVNFVQNNEIIEELRAKIKTLKRTVANQKEQKALSDFDATLLSLTDRNEAKAAFLGRAAEMHNDLLVTISKKYKSLTAGEREMLVLIILKLNYKEIASIFGVKPSTVIVKRYKLRKKLGIPRGETFEYFIRRNIYRA